MLGLAWSAHVICLGGAVKSRSWRQLRQQRPPFGVRTVYERSSGFFSTRVAGVQVPLVSVRWTCWPVWSGGRSQVLRSWYFSCVRWWACRFLWTAVSWGVWEESRGRSDLSCQEYRSLAGEGRLLSMGVVRRHSRERSGSVLLCLTLSMIFLTVWTMHSANPLDWGIWVSL